MWQPADGIIHEPWEISLRQVVQTCLFLSGATEEAIRQTWQGTVLQSVEQLGESAWLFSNGCGPPGHFYALALADGNTAIESRLAGWSEAWRNEHTEAVKACRTFVSSRGVRAR